MTWRTSLAAAALLTALAAGGVGCALPTSASYPLPRNVVWRVATAEAFSWVPERIDEAKGVIYVNQYDRSGRRFEISIQVKDESYLGQPTTRIEIIAQQSQPQVARMAQLESDYLVRVREALSQYLVSPDAGQGGNTPK